MCNPTVLGLNPASSPTHEACFCSLLFAFCSFLPRPCQAQLMFFNDILIHLLPYLLSSRQSFSISDAILLFFAVLMVLEAFPDAIMLGRQILGPAADGSEESQEMEASTLWERVSKAKSEILVLLIDAATVLLQRNHNIKHTARPVRCAQTRLKSKPKIQRWKIVTWICHFSLYHTHLGFLL